MRPSEVYAKAESVFSLSPTLQTIPRVQNTYQEKLVDSEASIHLRDSGIVICYYFLRVLEPTETRPNLIIAPSLFTFAVIENVTQHKKWNESNREQQDPDATFKIKSALEVAEEVLVTLQQRCGLSPCGYDPVKFPKATIERVQADGGIAQIDVNVLAPTQIKLTK